MQTTNHIGIVGVRDHGNSGKVVVDIQTYDGGLRELDEEVVPIGQVLDAARKVQHEHDVRLPCATCSLKMFINNNEDSECLHNIRFVAFQLFN